MDSWHLVTLSSDVAGGRGAWCVLLLFFGRFRMAFGFIWVALRVHCENHVLLPIIEDWLVWGASQKISENISRFLAGSFGFFWNSFVSCSFEDEVQTNTCTSGKATPPGRRRCTPACENTFRFRVGVLATDKWQPIDSHIQFILRWRRCLFAIPSRGIDFGKNYYTQDAARFGRQIVHVDFMNLE